SGCALTMAGGLQPRRRRTTFLDFAFLGLVALAGAIFVPSQASSQEPSGGSAASQPRMLPPRSEDELWAILKPHFEPQDEYRDGGPYRPPRRFTDGSPGKRAPDWNRRRQELLDTWHDLMGSWPAPLGNPAIELREAQQRGDLTQYEVRLDIAPGMKHRGILLMPP